MNNNKMCYRNTIGIKALNLCLWGLLLTLSRQIKTLNDNPQEHSSNYYLCFSRNSCRKLSDKNVELMRALFAVTLNLPYSLALNSI